MKNTRAEDSLIPSRSSLVETDSAFAVRSDLTYKIMDGIALTGIDVRQSLLTGSLMRNLKIGDSSFERCDFEGTRIESCEFKNTSFASADVRSSEFSRTTFTGCVFDDAFIKNCTFSDCTFVNCSFDTSAFTESSLLRCTLSSVSLQGSSNMLNIFQECRFESVILGDCTFLLHVCRDCSFVDIAFNLDSIGLLFGIGKETIEQNRFVFLGEEQQNVTGEAVCEKLIEEYERRKWFLQAGVAKLNFGRISPLEFLSYISRFIQLSVEHNIIVKQEDVVFLGNIFAILYESDRLPYFGLMTLLEEVGVLSASKRELGAQNEASIHMLMNSAYLNLFRLQKRIAGLMPRVRPELLSDQSRFEIAFKNGLSVDICRLLDTVALAAGGRNPGTKLIAVRKGSVIYYVYSVVASVLGLQLLIWAMNGCLIQFTELLARVKALQEGPPEAYTEIARSPNHPMPQEVQQTMDMFYKSMMDSGLITHRLSQDLSRDNFLSIETPSADASDGSKTAQPVEEPDQGSPE